MTTAAYRIQLEVDAGSLPKAYYNLKVIAGMIAYDGWTSSDEISCTISGKNVGTQVLGNYLTSSKQCEAKGNPE